MIKKTVKIIDKLGIHARPATVVVSCASKFECDCKVLVGEKQGNLKSMMGVMALGIKYDNEVELVFDGVDENSALESVLEVMSAEGLI